MNFIWDIVLNAENQNINKSDLFFKQATVYSPWYEQSFDELNQANIDSFDIEINALYRFNHIFKEILHPEFIQSDDNIEVIEFVEYLFDILIHALSEIDLKHGLTKREFFVRKLRQELLLGEYGTFAAETMKTMELKLQFKMANELLSQVQTGSNLASFRRAMLAAFPDCFIYQSNFNCKEILIYLGKRENDVYQKQFKFIIDTFLPLGFNVKVFWEHHFGIIGVDATMPADNIALF